MIPQPPPGQGPIDPQPAFAPPPVGGAPQGFPPRPAGPSPMGYPPPPGGYAPMPPMFMPPPPPPRRGGGWKTVFLVLTILLLIGSLAINLLLLGSLFLGSTPIVLQSTIAEGSPTQKIAVVPIEGLINDAKFDQFDNYMKQAEEDGTVKGVVLAIDSPGGTVSASDQIYHRIQKFKRRKPNAPVVVSMGGLAASGGYYAACGAEQIFAQPTTLTGSIGVIMPRYNFSKLAEKYGVEENSVYSGSFKNAGSPFHTETPEQRKYWQDLIDHTFGQFSDIVKNARGTAMAATTQPTSISDVANGKVFSAEDAVKLGLVDQIGYLEDAWQYVANKVGVQKPMVVRYQRRPTLRDLFEPEAKAAARAMMGGERGATVQVDAELIERLMAGSRPLYLWNGN